MIPDQIVNDLLHTKDKVDGAIKAIEAIKQYAREMCDKQRYQCYNKLGVSPNSEYGKSILKAPYPKELL